MRLLFSALILTVLLASTLQAETYDFRVTPGQDDTYSMARYRIWWPDDVDVVRGVYFFVNPLNSDSRNIVSSPSFQNLCRQYQFAVMGAQMDRMHMDSGIGDALLKALGSFSGQSGHPEIEHLPIFFDGWSWGGQWSYHFTKWRPQQVLGFITQKGGAHQLGDAGPAIQVPGYLFIGEFENNPNLISLFLNNRALGARWALAIQPNSGHARVTDRTFLDPWFGSVVRARLPKTIIPGKPVSLRNMDEQAGWLGDDVRYRIGRFHCYEGDIDAASWFPDQNLARDWIEFSNPGHCRSMPEDCEGCFSCIDEILPDIRNDIHKFWPQDAHIPSYVGMLNQCQ